MKKILVLALILAIVTCACFSCIMVAAAEDPDIEAAIPCMVTGDRVNERVGPSKRYDSVCQHNKGEILDVIDTSGTWWQLANGNYMHSKYLEPMCSNDVDPDTEYIEEETEDPTAYLVTEDDEYEPEDLDPATYARLFNFTTATPGTTKEQIVPLVHDCVLLITREQCIECYHEDQLVLRISLVLSTPYVKFAVDEGNGVIYEVNYIRDVAGLIISHSTDNSHFVIID